MPGAIMAPATAATWYRQLQHSPKEKSSAMHIPALVNGQNWQKNIAALPMHPIRYWFLSYSFLG